MQLCPNALISISKYLFLTGALLLPASWLVLFLLRDDDWTFSPGARDADPARTISTPLAIIAVILGVIGISGGLESWIGISLGRALLAVAFGIGFLLVLLFVCLQVIFVRGLHSWLGRNELNLSNISVSSLAPGNRVIESRMAGQHWCILAVGVAVVVVAVWIGVEGTCAAKADHAACHQNSASPGKLP